MSNNQSSSFKCSSIFYQCKEFIDRILNSLPFFVKIVTSSTVILYLINFIIPYVAYLLAQIPYFTIYYFQIWRIFTTPFMTTSLLSVIFSIFFWYDKASRLEKEIGTIKYMLIFFMNSFFIQIIFCIIMLLLSFILRSERPLRMKITNVGIRNDGIWPILLCDITLLCLSNPNENIYFRFLPCNIKAKYYPLILFLIYTFISQFHIDLENLCGIGFGFLYHYYLRNRLNISNNLAEKIGNSCLFRWMKTQKGYIGIGGINTFGNTGTNTDNNVRNVNIENSSIKENKEKVKNTFSAFKGKGIAVGGGDNTDSNNKIEANKIDGGDFNNVTVNSNDEINSSENRIDLDSPK